MGAQRGLKPVLAVKDDRQFLRRLVAERITDDHKNPVVLTLGNHRPHTPFEEPVLIGHIVDPPLLQQAVTRIRGHLLAPGHRQRIHEPLVIARLDLLAKRLEHIPAFDLGEVRRFAELAVQLVESI